MIHYWESFEGVRMSRARLLWRERERERERELVISGPGHYTEGDRIARRLDEFDNLILRHGRYGCTCKCTAHTHGDDDDECVHNNNVLLHHSYSIWRNNSLSFLSPSLSPFLHPLPLSLSSLNPSLLLPLSSPLLLPLSSPLPPLPSTLLSFSPSLPQHMLGW